MTRIGRFPQLAVTLLALVATPQSAMAGPAISPVGIWRASEGPELAAHLQLTSDGHFRYELIYGALDETAAGDWRMVDGHVVLETRPKPKPPEFLLTKVESAPDKQCTVIVQTAQGRGIAGIDLVIGMDKGDPLSGYTQTYGWSGEIPPGTRPLWIELAEPMNAVQSARLPLPDGACGKIIVTFVPNDIGTVDFVAAPVDIDSDRMVLHHPRGNLRFVKVPER
jgi:hypothetical protein